MDNDINKKTCVRCNKKDCESCVEEGDKSFCCQSCCDEHKKVEGRKEEPANVCRFC